MWKKIVVGILVVVMLGAGVTTVHHMYLNDQQIALEQAQAKSRQEAEQARKERVSLAILSYLAEPKFRNEDLLKQVCGIRGSLEIYDLDEQAAYFGIADTQVPKDAVRRLTRKPEDVQWAILEKDGRLLVGNYSFRIDHTYFCRIPAADFHVNPQAIISIPFDQVTYTVSVSELAGWIENRVLICGPTKFRSHINDQGHEVRVHNFGSWVTKPGEPSLTRLVHTVVGEEQGKERQAQLLLDFVTTQIDYDRDEEKWDEQLQVIRRGVESILTKRATCASKAVLYASLLNQIGIDYRLGYYPTKQHLTVYVGGNYPNNNHYQIVVDGTGYSLAEPTLPNFVIGKTRIDEHEMQVLADLMWLNQPGSREFVDPHSGAHKRLTQ